MSDGSDSRSRGDGPGVAADASGAFDLVADETRLAILRTLWDLTDGRDESVGFARLREETGVRDSGQFNYHLGKLRPAFVRKTDDGYALTEPGRRVVGAVVSGVYTDEDDSLTIGDAGDCPVCGAPLALTHDDGVVTLECRDCEPPVLDLSVPPVLVARVDPDEALETINQYALTEIQRMNRGFCVYCGGPLAVTVDPDGCGGWSREFAVTLECEACRKLFSWDVVLSVVDHSATIALFHDAGTDVRSVPVWELPAVLDPSVRLLSADPVEIEVTVRTDGRALTLTLDGSLDVVDTEADVLDTEADVVDSKARDADERTRNAPDKGVPDRSSEGT